MVAAIAARGIRRGRDLDRYIGSADGLDIAGEWTDTDLQRPHGLFYLHFWYVSSTLTEGCYSLVTRWVHHRYVRSSPHRAPFRCCNLTLWDSGISIGQIVCVRDPILFVRDGIIYLFRSARNLFIWHGMLYPWWRRAVRGVPIDLPEKNLTLSAQIARRSCCPSEYKRSISRLGLRC